MNFSTQIILTALTFLTPGFTGIANIHAQNEAKRFQPDLIDPRKNSFALTFAPDGQSFYFTQSDTLPDGTYGGILFVSRLINNIWTKPQVMSFSGRYEDYDPVPSPDGNKIYFMSVRPISGGKSRPDNDMWVVKRQSRSILALL